MTPPCFGKCSTAVQLAQYDHDFFFWIEKNQIERSQIDDVKGSPQLSPFPTQPSPNSALSQLFPTQPFFHLFSQVPPTQTSTNSALDQRSPSFSQLSPMLP